MTPSTRRGSLAVGMGELSEIRYARSGDLFIAYRVAGSGPYDLLVAPPYLTHVEQNFEWPAYREFIAALSTFSRVIVFDRRGSGLSDRLRANGNFDEVMEDITAVLDDVGCERAALLGFNDGGPLCTVYAAAHPERSSALVLFSSYARGTSTDDYPWAPSSEEHERGIQLFEAAYGRRPIGLGFLAPTLAQDPGFRRYVVRAQRYGASPGAAIEWFRMTAAIDIRDVLPSIRVPTLVLHREAGDARVIGAARHLAASIPGARLVALPGESQYAVIGDWRRLVEEIERFVTGSHRSLEADRVLATVLFTDIVGSTELARRAGDIRWRDVLAAHDSTVRRLLDEYDGREVKTTGDGFLATFSRPGSALRCAIAVRAALAAIGLQVRAGLHAGEVEGLGDDIGGIAVHIASRILAAAPPGEVLLSRTVRDLVAGSDLRFTDCGDHVLKGLEEPWRLYAVPR